MKRTLPEPPASALDLFLSLVQIPSPSQHEGALAAAIQEWLTAAGVPFEVDDSAEQTGSDTGNIIVRTGHDAESPTVLFVAHMDTVQAAGRVIRPVIDGDGVIRSAGSTILGADNKAGVAALLSLIASQRARDANVIAVFTTGEERGRMGVAALQREADRADVAFPIDGSYPVGTVLESALGQLPFEVQIQGREAHAARAPDQGVHAIKVACETVARLTLGWEGDTVLNISRILGGSETNIVPGLAKLRGEVRGYSDQDIAARLGIVKDAANAAAAAAGARAEVMTSPGQGAPAFPAARLSLADRIASEAAHAAGLAYRRERCTATLEANFLHAMGLPTLGIASGGQNPHSSEESLPQAELALLVAFLEAVLAAAASASGNLGADDE